MKVVLKKPLKLQFVPSLRAGLKGGPEGHVPPPEEAKSALKNDKKKQHFSCTSERKGGGRGAQIEL